MFEIVEEWDELGTDFITWRCKHCSYEVSTEANGEPSCCPSCIEQDAHMEENNDSGNKQGKN